jgi:succinate dehydrogenase / fumarate reductase membrane anchor subunit
MKAVAGSHSGTGAWLMQRATAVLLALLLPFLLWRVLAAMPLDHATWRALFAPAAMRATFLLAACALALHAWVGMRDIFMDYVRATTLRLALDLAVVATLAGSVLWLFAMLGNLA